MNANKTTFFYCWLNGSGYTEYELKTKSKAHVIKELIGYRGAYARFSDWWNNMGKDWHVYENGVEIDVLFLINKDNYPELLKAI